MARVGDLIWSREGECLGVIEEILHDHFAVRVRGGAVVNYEDVAQNSLSANTCTTPNVQYKPKENKEYVELYTLLDGQR